MRLKKYKSILLLTFLTSCLLSIQACQKGISWDEGIAPGQPPGQTPATDTMASFTLIKSGSRCALVNVRGDYTSGITLNNTNEAQLDINVIRAGAYSIYTPVSNGISFVSTGRFSATGKQAITLKGTGTPIDSGTITIIISDASTTCSFTLRVLRGTQSAAGGNYFPLSGNSFWKFEDNSPTVPSNTMTITSTGTSVTYNGKSYVRFVNTYSDTNYYRKEGNVYYQYGKMSYMTNGLIDEPPIIEYVFLKDNVAVGTTWETPEYPTTQSGTSSKAKMTFEVTSRDSTIIRGNKTATIHVKTKVLHRDGALGWREAQSWYSNYANNVGLYDFADSRRMINWTKLSDYRVY